MSTVAFLFPGQGSHRIGMGVSLAQQHAAAREVFAEVDEALGQALFRLMSEGSEDELTLTANAQPALMAVSMAAARVLEVEAGRPIAALGHYLAGHSLGEYSALCAARSLSLADTARVLRARGEAMQSAVPPDAGAMAAILGLEFDQILALVVEAERETGEACDIANDNAEGQVVISGTAAAVAKASSSAQAAGAKRVVPLKVSAPFHSRLMLPAAEAMAEVLAEISVRAPDLPLVSNVEASPNQAAERVRPLLIEQVTARVRWRETLGFLVAEGVDTFVELGSGKVLTGLAKRAARGAHCLSFGEAEELDALLAAL